MPASPLSPEQLADAAALKRCFKQWQERQRLAGEPYSQEHASEILGFGQSALSQYLNGRIPLNPEAADKFARLMGVKIAAFSTATADEIAKFSSNVSAPIASLLGGAIGSALGAIGGASFTVPHTAIQIPVLSANGSMGDGEDQPLDDIVVGSISLSPEWVKQLRRLTSPKNLRFIHGYGDSMEPTYFAGDILLVDTGVKEVLIDGVYVLEAHKRLFIKRVTQDLSGRYEITSDNAKVKTVSVLNGSELIQVLGRVVYAWNGKSL